MEQNEILARILQEIGELKAKHSQQIPLNPVSDKWLPLPVVRSFLNYGATQIASLIKDGSLTASTIGKRKFILKESLETLLSKNITK